MAASLLKSATGPIALVFALAWVGCEGSPVPLSDPPSVAVDPTLVGEWEYVADEDEGGDRARVFAFNDHEYLVEYREANREEDGSVTYDDLQRIRMFVTEIDGRSFLNVRCIDCEDDAWLFLELALEARDRAVLTVVSDEVYKDLEDDVTPGEVLARLRDVVAKPEGTTDAALFRKIDA